MIEFFSSNYKLLQRGWMLFLLMLCLGIFAPVKAAAASPATPVKPIEVQVSLGNEANELKFFPNNLEFVAGKMYKLLPKKIGTLKATSIYGVDESGREQL